MMASKCKPVNLPGSDCNVLSVVGSLMSGPDRPSMAISKAIAMRFFGPTFLKVCGAPEMAMKVQGLYGVQAYQPVMPMDAAQASTSSRSWRGSDAMESLMRSSSLPGSSTPAARYGIG